MVMEKKLRKGRPQQAENINTQNTDTQAHWIKEQRVINILTAPVGISDLQDSIMIDAKS